MKKFTQTIGAAFASLALMLAFSPSANALSVKLISGATSVEVTDGGAGDVNPTVGAVTSVASVGDFVTNVTTGISKPLQGSDIQPYLDLNSVDVSSAAGGTLEIWLTEVDFFGTSNTLQFLSNVGGTLGTGATSIQVDYYVDAGNVAYGTATQVGSLFFNTVGAFGGTDLDVALGLLDSNYSMTIKATIIHAASATTSFDAELRVPEPQTIALMGLGLLGLGFSRRRKA